MLDKIQSLATDFSTLAWGPWLLVLLLGGGTFFLLYSRFLPFKYLPHAWGLLRGRHDKDNAPGQISHFGALSAALAGTIGMGNIGGVALAITIGGPGAIFWMWVTAIVGIATKFFTCTLAVLYRAPDADGSEQGGPMYVITQGLPKRWHFLATLFATAGMIGCLPAFQTNQLVQIFREVVMIDQGWLAADSDHLLFNLSAGGLIAVLSSLVIFGGIQRIAQVATKLVPLMSVLYIGTALAAIVSNITQVPDVFVLIVTDAFSGEAVAGGALLSVILYGVQRGAFSNEAGIGTEALAHGAARTNEPVREGLVAMCGPIIDTLLVCTATAVIIIISGVWQDGGLNGVTLTANAFSALVGPAGLVVIFVCILCFATTTIFTYSFYGSQCAGFLFGRTAKTGYRAVYIGFILVAAVISLDTAVSIIDGAYALMAIPTMVSALWLAPRVVASAKDYFARLDGSRSHRSPAKV